MSKEDGQIYLEDAGVQQLLRRLQQRMLNLKRPMDEIGQIITASVEKNFAAGGRWSGTVGQVMGGSEQWRPLKPSTIRKRTKARTWPGKILQVSAGGLAASIAAKATEDSVTVGTNKVYAAPHQFGATISMKGRNGSIRLRTDTKGNLLRQAREGKLRNLAVFAKGHHKRAVERSFSGKDYTIDIPARPYLVVQEEDLTEIRAAILRHLATDTR